MLSHTWNLTPRRALVLQRKLAGLVRTVPLAGPVRTIAGADCARLGQDSIVAAAVLCDARTMEVIAAAGAVQPCRFPYVPGLLSFREAPAVIAAVDELEKRNRAPGRSGFGLQASGFGRNGVARNANPEARGPKPEACPPDLLMCDGQGVAHPRRLGLAAHIGLWVDVPTIGVAKSRLCGRHRPVGLSRGCRTRLTDAGEVIGSVVRTRAGVKPLYVSVGGRITLAESIRWVLRAARRCRLPEPTRQAHILVNAIVAALRQGVPAVPERRDKRGNPRLKSPTSCRDMEWAIQSYLAGRGRV